MKNNTTKLFIFLLFVLCIILGINYFYQPILKKYMRQVNQAQDSEVAVQEIESTILKKQNLMEQMTPRQKVVQLLAFPVLIENEKNQKIISGSGIATMSSEIQEFEEGLDEVLIATESQKITEMPTLDWIKNNHPGFITIFGKKIDKEVARLAINNIHDQYQEYELKPIIAVDHEGGEVQRFSGKDFTILPSWKDSCASSIEKNNLLFNSSARDLAEVGVNVVFAPVVDLAENNRVLKSRVCGDYAQALSTADLFIGVFSQYQIMPVLKHFPGIGKTTKDLHQSFDIVDLGIEDSNAFKDLLDLYPNLGLMTTHVGLKDVMEDLPCSLSADCLEKMTNFYPESLFFSDALEMKSTGYNPDSRAGRSLDQISVEAVLAGNNVLVFGEGVSEEVFNQIIKRMEFEYNDSASFRKKVDISVAKILLLKKIEY